MKPDFYTDTMDRCWEELRSHNRTGERSGITLPAPVTLTQSDRRDVYPPQSFETQEVV